MEKTQSHGLRETYLYVFLQGDILKSHHLWGQRGGKTSWFVPKAGKRKLALHKSPQQERNLATESTEWAENRRLFWGHLCHSGLSFISESPTQEIILYKPPMSSHKICKCLGFRSSQKRPNCLVLNVFSFFFDWVLASFHHSKYLPSGSSLETSFWFS